MVSSVNDMHEALVDLQVIGLMINNAKKNGMHTIPIEQYEALLDYAILILRGTQEIVEFVEEKL